MATLTPYHHLSVSHPLPLAVLHRFRVVRLPPKIKLLNDHDRGVNEALDITTTESRKRSIRIPQPMTANSKAMQKILLVVQPPALCNYCFLRNQEKHRCQNHCTALSNYPEELLCMLRSSSQSPNKISIISSKFSITILQQWISRISSKTESADLESASFRL